MKSFSSRSFLDDKKIIKARIVRSNRTIQKAMVITIFSLLLFSIISYTVFASSNMTNPATNAGVNSTSNVLSNQIPKDSGNIGGKCYCQKCYFTNRRWNGRFRNYNCS